MLNGELTVHTQVVVVHRHTSDRDFPSKTTPPGQEEKATKPDNPYQRVFRTRSSGNGQAGEQSFESQSNSIIDLTSSPEAPNTKKVKMKAAL